MTPLRTVIVDDEHWAIKRLEAQLKSMDGVEVIGTAKSGDEAAAIVRQTSPDLLLLDIKMPGMNGFEVVRALSDGVPPAVVFITAFEEYAPAAFGVEAVDYLLKPVETERLARAVERVRRHRDMTALAERAGDLEHVVEAIRRDRRQQSSARYEQELWIRNGERSIRVEVAQVDWIESDRDYAIVHIRDRSYLLRRSLTQLAKTLDPNDFVRVHRSVIVRRTLVLSIERRKGRAAALVLTNGVKVPIGTTYSASVGRALRRAH